MTADADARRLPRLRPDLHLLRGAATSQGAPTWLIHDALLNRYVQIDLAACAALRHWHDCPTPGELIARVNAGGEVRIDEGGLQQLVAFLHASRLTEDPPAHGWRHFAAEREALAASPLGRLVHDYLFFRIPLCQPQAFLERTLPVARALASPPVRALVACLGLVGLYLVSREWDTFAATLHTFLTWEGAAFVGCALILVKAAHELGHAYTAAALGVRVHTMGVAFMVLAPLLYTDVSDAWRLRDRRRRSLIDGAGIRVELAIAAVALFLWAFLPEGPLRAVAFVLSAVSAASTLSVNLNPFMRFDGYYLLSDWIGVDNLQSRAFALGRWQLREVLFRPGLPAPEALPSRLATGLVLYAWATWLYRLVLLTGIALLVYQYFFKVLGIILFAVEIVYFVGRPIMSELGFWLHNRRLLATRRALLTACLAATGLALSLVPWSTRVEIPAVLESARLEPIHAPRPARVVRVHVQHGASIRAGDELITLHSPDIEQELEAARIKLALARLQHARRGADAADRASSIVLESTIAGLLARIEGLEREREDLRVRARFDGSIVELDPALAAGRWVSPREALALLAASDRLVARGYVAEADLWRVAPGAVGRFVPDQPLRESVPVRIEQIAAAGSAQIEIAELASRHAGPIAVAADDRQRLVPASAQYLVHMMADAAPLRHDLTVRGLVLAEGRPQSLLARAWRQTLKVLVRESGA